MTDDTIHFGPPLVVVLVVLALLAAVVVRYGSLGRGWTPLIAAGRAIVQLTLVSLVITAVLRSLTLTGLFVLLMFSIAAWTSARRIDTWRALPWTALTRATGANPRTDTHADHRRRAAVPAGGRSHRRHRHRRHDDRHLASREAGARRTHHPTRRIRSSTRTRTPPPPRRTRNLPSLRRTRTHPPLDQTRTVGLVTLTGAYVGVLLGGASPLQAGITQTLVLIGLLASEAAAILATVNAVAAGKTRRANDNTTSLRPA